jgi:hypothetical protein
MVPEVCGRCMIQQYPLFIVCHMELCLGMIDNLIEWDAAAWGWQTEKY